MPLDQPQMASLPRTRNDYTVGWICALPKEQVAATAMLDHTHSGLPRLPNDDNVYTLGSIGSHNIVVACLPKGKIGTVSAATVATQMIHAFPSVKFGLMVGIGGGVPPKVRLGDVVVGTPVGQYPGVVQWDLGKKEKGNKFTRTGSLNNPPSLLLNAVSKLEAEYELTGSKILDYLNEMVSKYPRLAPKYQRSESFQDVLFKASYEHNESIPDPADGDLPEDEEEEENCQRCDMAQAVQRKPRDMRVHYGLIASGNSVIKNATLRESLRSALGKDMLCVEMEAAGLMDRFPCIVIRGICDYADSHKNKVWQEHAAALAAAYAKELLGYIQPTDVDKEQAVKDMLTNISSVISTIQEDVTHTKSRLQEKQDVEVLDWLTPTDYGPQQTDYLGRRQEGTGQWLLSSEEYQNWTREPNKTLFCPGIPGAGKTILTSVVIDDLEKRFYNSGSTAAVAYVYCNYKRQSEQTPESLLSSLLKQLGQIQPSLPHSLTELYDRHKVKRTRPSLDEVSKALESVIIQNSRVFIIVDALDECKFLDGCRTEFLSAIFNLQKTKGINIFATSRPLPEIADVFQGSLSKEIRATKDDIGRYLQGHILKLPGIVRNLPALQNEIMGCISDAVDGMYVYPKVDVGDTNSSRFLLAQLHFASLIGKDTIKAIRKALKKLVKGSSAYDTAYEHAMERIEGQIEEQAERAKQVLLWITCAKRPLKKQELQHALAVEKEEPQLDKDNIPQIEDVVSVCAGLVTVDEESNIVRLVHYTTQDYFTRTQSKWFPDAQTAITTTCTAYLSYQDFANGYCQTDEEFKQRFLSYPFYNYAACNWGHHCREISIHQDVIDFLRKPAQVEASSQALIVGGHYNRNDSQYAPRKTTGLHLAAYCGLNAVIANTIWDYNIDIRDSHGRTPLSWAAEEGHETVVRLLLATKGVDLDSEDKGGRTPLWRAARIGHEAIVDLLLATGRVDPNLTNCYGQTPLLWAAKNGHEAIVRLLLATKEIDLDSEDKYGWTPLLWAAENGHEGIVALLKGEHEISTAGAAEVTVL